VRGGDFLGDAAVVVEVDLERLAREGAKGGEDRWEEVHHYRRRLRMRFLGLRKRGLGGRGRERV
jgi:hypothetical protein